MSNFQITRCIDMPYLHTSVRTLILKYSTCLNLTSCSDNLLPAGISAEELFWLWCTSDMRLGTITIQLKLSIVDTGTLVAVTGDPTDISLQMKGSI